jgi:hypothetical protein
MENLSICLLDKTMRGVENWTRRVMHSLSFGSSQESVIIQEATKTADRTGYEGECGIRSDRPRCHY